MTTDKWDGLLDEDTPQPPGPPPRRRAPAILAAAALAATAVAAGAHAIHWAQGPDPTTGPSSSPAQQPSTTALPHPGASAPTASAPDPTAPSPTTQAGTDVFAPARRAADAWLHAYMDDRKEGAPWTTTSARLVETTTRELMVYMVNVPDAQSAGVVWGTTVTAVSYTDETADADHPTTWSAMVAYTRSDGTTGTGRITLVPRRGGWQTDQWEAAQ